MISATCIAPVNIAVIKYWGKRDKHLILPYNDSISGTLSMEQMCAKTTVAASPDFAHNKFWLNGTETSIKTNERMKNCLKALKVLAAKKKVNKTLLKQKLHISSENNFPTAAGLASSAAGYACFVYTVASLYGIEGEDLTIIARQGSGSACRSIHGGFVHWKKGELADGTDSVAVQVADELHWPEMRVLIVVVNDKKKKVSSTEGMATTTLNSELFSYRVGHVVAKRVAVMNKCIAEKDFETFAELTMKDSNQFHAVCLDSYPPLVYMNDVSHKIASLVHTYNKHHNAAKVAYTFDAGPNACLYMLDTEVSNFITILNVVFPCSVSHTNAYVRGIPVQYINYEPADVQDIIGDKVYEKNLLKYMIVTKLGAGAKKLEDPEQSLLGADGLPKIVVPPPKKIKIEDTSDSVANDTSNTSPSIKIEMMEQSEPSPTIAAVAADSLDQLALESNAEVSTLSMTTSETPSNEILPNETPTNETPTNETPSNETPSNETPTTETPTNETPSN